ncbi:MAG: ferrochelatase [Sulfuricurvum sp.]|uniref:ferrochelatase n=1 Tax=Sulfuricurvum sp. TaxID=2025608 RepID=UPI0025CC75E3|nr:ferrochelatase [Sulfuricurvum sp.]MBV5320674.1 ferrochelatase [Sulfuricurvum sp.]
MTKRKVILLLNMGGPNNLSEVKIFLNNMFNDHRIISAPKPIRRMIAWLITSRRHKEAEHNYSLIGGKSPILGHTHHVVKALSEHVDADVHYVMRYTPPFTNDVLQSVASYDEIYAIPLYPHFSTTTTLSSFDALYEEAQKLGISEKIRTVDRYYNDLTYNATIVERIKEALGNDNESEFELIFSAHGLPKKIIDHGDLYQRHIRANVYYARRALNEAGIFFHNTHLAYQSRLGPMEWIRPYLEDKLRSLKKKKVIIYPIAFTIDNSETEFELDIEYREKAEAMGFEEYRLAKAPNDHPLFIQTLQTLYYSMHV